jgi:hypothetical protein
MAGSKLLEKHMKALKAIEGKKVEAGWFASDIYPAGGTRGNGQGEAVPVARVARILEFGATIRRTAPSGKAYVINIPARPFMRYAWSQFSKDRMQVQAKIAHKLIQGQITADQALGQIGLAIEGHIARSIKSGPWAPNAAATIRIKGFDKPLIDTGHMWKTVSSKVS